MTIFLDLYLYHFKKSFIHFNPLLQQNNFYRKNKGGKVKLSSLYLSGDAKINE
jgi:hypothetical protein